MGLDPSSAIVGFIWDKIKEGVWAQWLRLLFQIFFSAIVSFLYGFSATVALCGVAILAGAPTDLTPAWTFVLALGSGAGWAAISATKAFRAAPDKLMKGVQVVLPEAEAAEEFAQKFQTQTLTKPK
jgi:hypothetical protein